MRNLLVLFFFILSILLFHSSSYSQVTVTYKVDITNYLNAGNTLGANGMRIAGDFADLGAGLPNWAPTDAACAMIRQGNTNVWSISITYPLTAPGKTQHYKFVNNDWGTNEGVDVSNTLIADGCGINDGSGNINRVLVIPAANTQLLYCWDHCSACVNITYYTFTGTGNWNLAANWLNNMIPPSSLPANAQIIINPAGNGECILNTTQTITAGATITVITGKRFMIPGNLTMQ